MKIYRVGGAVRDELLGLPVKDIDYVVVGATVDDMLKQGFKQVGRDFPVFLHPKTKDEYALARTERKIGPGYQGFAVHASPEVTLEEDLARRDVTVNAIARDGDGNLIDPYRGKADLEAGILRHVSPAFAEDPVRILRVARFAARFGFKIAPETMQLMRDMVARGEADALVAERVWQEFARGLMEAMPSRMFEVLQETQALARIAPELETMLADSLRRERALGALDYAALRECNLAIRFAALTHRIDDGSSSAPSLTALCNRLRVPSDCRELARLAIATQEAINDSRSFAATDTALVLERCDAYRRPGRFIDLLKVCACIFHADPKQAESPYPQAVVLQRDLAAAQEVDVGDIVRSDPDPGSLRERIHAARVGAIAAARASG
jgi:tRNA nucleotidyltransferase (CCA-adding enzyme)